MCGIAGFYSQRADGEMTIRQMTLALHHRGPDGQSWISPAPGVWLGHARLKVIDLSEEAAQPMEKGDSWIVFNGEIYNYRKLRADLEQEGFTFRSQSDTEVILAMYKKFGSGCVQRLDGMYAFAIWDGEKIFLARDFSGKKPLYYRITQNDLIFASEPKGILKFTGAKPDQDRIPYGAVFGSPPATRSWYQGIDQLPPGSHATYFPAGKSLQIEWWWRYPRPGKIPVRPEQRVRQLLSEAVAKRLVADVPLGAFLSGGIDSSIVVGLMREIQPRGEIRTFSAKFVDDPRYDESHFAEMVARHHGTHHTTLPIRTPEDRLLQAVMERHDGPFGDSSAIPFYLLSREAKKHVTVALTGDGGDEVFGGYVRMRACLWAEAMRPWLRTHFFRNDSSPDPKKLVSRIRRFFKAASLPMPERLWRWISLMEPADFGKSWLDLDPSLQERWKESEGWPLENRVLHMNFTQYLTEDLLPKGDRNSMAEGLEIRCPFLDRSLVEFAAGLPGRAHFDWFRGKKLLRKACADLLPREILKRKKMGFGIPLQRSNWSGVEVSGPSALQPLFSNMSRFPDLNSQGRFFLDQANLFFARPDQRKDPSSSSVELTPASP